MKNKVYPRDDKGKMEVYKAAVGAPWWHSGSARVSHQCDSGSIPAPCGYLIKITLVTCEKSVVKFDSTKHRRFTPGIPVSSCSNTGSMRGGPYWTSRENSSGSC